MNLPYKSWRPIQYKDSTFNLKKQCVQCCLFRVSSVTSWSQGPDLIMQGKQKTEIIPRHSFMFRSFRLCSALSVVVSANFDIIRYVYWCRWTKWSSLSVVSVTALWQLYDIYKTIRHLMITQVLLFWMKQEIPQGRLWHTCTGNVNLCLHR